MNDNRVDEGIALLREINAFRLDPDLLQSAMQSYAEADPATRETSEGYIALVMTAVRASGLLGDSAVTAAMAVQFRLSALQRLLRDGGGRGFRSAGVQPGREYLSEALVQSVAEEPLVEADGPVQFDASSFHRRLLSIASTVGRA